MPLLLLKDKHEWENTIELEFDSKNCANVPHGLNKASGLYAYPINTRRSFFFDEQTLRLL
jgi:hypothetical protein